MYRHRQVNIEAHELEDTFNNKERVKESFTRSHPGGGEGQEVLSYEVKGLSWKAGFLFLVAVASVLCLTNTKDFSSTPAAFKSSDSKAHVGRLHSPDTDIPTVKSIPSYTDFFSIDNDSEDLELTEVVSDSEFSIAEPGLSVVLEISANRCKTVSKNSG